jgi:pyruvate kinase
MIICRAENEGELKEKKPIYIPGLDFNKDLNLSVLGHKDIKILQNAIA